MRNYLRFYINGAWVDPVTAEAQDVINTATEAVAGRVQRVGRPPFFQGRRCPGPHDQDVRNVGGQAELFYLSNNSDNMTNSIGIWASPKKQ